MRMFKVALLAACAAGSSAFAGPFFGRGIGSAMEYGPYTGGHLYSHNTAYGYGLSFTAADSWRRDPLAYPAGITPYRPYERPIQYRAFPINPAKPPIAVPGEDGLPVLRTPTPPTPLGPPIPGVPLLQPVPAAVNTGTVKVVAPAGAKVWVEAQELSGDGERTFTTPALGAGAMRIYSVRAKWNEAGRHVEQIRVVGVRAGETARVSFTSP